MVYNTKEEIRLVCLLESENKTLTDAEVDAYIANAYADMVSDIKRAVERDFFTADLTGTITLFPYLNVASITAIKVNDTVIPADRYSLVYNNDGVQITSVQENDEIEILYIPTNYKMLEKAYCIVNIMSRLNPFTGDTVNPVYAEWREKKKNFTQILKSKFGAGTYPG